jgi:hypothetical protein
VLAGQRLSRNADLHLGSLGWCKAAVRIANDRPTTRSRPGSIGAIRRMAWNERRIVGRGRVSRSRRQPHFRRYEPP